MLSLKDLYIMMVVMMVSIPEINEKDIVLFQDFMINNLKSEVTAKHYTLNHIHLNMEP